MPLERSAFAPNGSVPPTPPAFTLVRFADMQPRLGDGYLVKGLLGSGSIGVIYGESGSGKTFLTLHLALCIASGRDFFGRRVRRAGVVYIAAEAGASIANRVTAARYAFDDPASTPFAAITSPIDLCTNEADLHKVIATVRTAGLERPVELIIIDTLSRVMAGANENAPDSMGALVRNIDRLRAETGACVVLVHHSGKDAAKGARGHSLLRAAVDVEIEVSRDNACEVSTFRVTKQREYTTNGSWSFTLRSVELGFDRDGDPVSSCVVEKADTGGNRAPKAARLSAAQSRALELLAEAVTIAGEIPSANNHIPQNTPCVTEALWREYCYRGAISSGEPHAQRTAFRRAAETLIAAGRVGKWEPLVWLA